MYTCTIFTEHEADWSEPSIESLPTYPNSQNKTNLYGAKSLDSLVTNSTTNGQMSLHDPFDTTQFWPVDTQSLSPRPNYNIHVDSSTPQINKESQIYSNNRYAASTSADTTRMCNNAATTSNHSMTPNNYATYGIIPTSTYTNTNALFMEKNDTTYEPTLAGTLAQMSLDDRISESLNLRSKNDNIYANSPSNYGNCEEPSTSTTQINNDRYKDIPIYNNFDMNAVQQQFVLETKDYYTKSSTPSETRPRNDYEKNIYVPKNEEGEKLKNFSESLEYSKNYSAIKYQNVDYSPYFYASSFGSVAGSMSRPEGQYDLVNDTASNFYSEIGESSQRIYGNQAQYSLYDEVFEAPTPRPHRPAPPCPKPK